MGLEGISKSLSFSAMFCMCESNLGKGPVTFIRFSKDFLDLQMVKKPLSKMANLFPLNLPLSLAATSDF